MDTTTATSATTPRPADLRNQELDPTSCELMVGDQHPVADIEFLADSITTLGQLNPVQVFEYPDGRRLIAAGRRRWYACKLRNLQMRADIWLCAWDEDINSENLARAMRIAENTERRDPSAIDIAFQLRRIRSENGFSTPALAAFVGMHESRIKRYLCVLQASDFLLETARSKSLSIKMVAELMRCEKHLGERNARKYVKQAGEGAISAAGLKRVRDTTIQRVPTCPSPSMFEKKVNRSAKELLARVKGDPSQAAKYAKDFVTAVEGFVEDLEESDKSSPQ